MIKAIVGHRGVGKTTLLDRWKIYQPEFEFIDLDSEIEKRTGLSVSDLFSQKGESEFRKIEVEVFLSLTQNFNLNRVISCGAGFDLSQIPESVFILWVCRDSDMLGRLLLDRPSLNINLLERESRYRKYAHAIYTMPEGLKSYDEEEKSILLKSNKIQACVTLTSKLDPVGIEAMFEWRDDLLTEDEFLDFKLQTQNILYSVRTEKKIPQMVMDQKYKIDWDIKRPIPQDVVIHYLSTHEDQIDNGINSFQKFENSDYNFKLCPMVSDWKDLKRGFYWQQEKPSHRNFLPRSVDGRWNWFRLYMKHRQSLNFVRTAQGSSLDQPTLWQWLSVFDRPVSRFAAVLGSPIHHSYSPAFHKAFFAQSSIPFFKIHLEEDDWSEAFLRLHKWGLTFAAVTSPLKKRAGEIVQRPALNTLAYDLQNQKWNSTNTDPIGFKALFQNRNQKSVVVWGGGGLLDLLKVELSDAHFYSARTGQPRENSQAIHNPEIIIWASGQSDIHQVPQSWKPQQIIDLSYVENSVARTLAQNLNCSYESGLTMFVEQARAQQDFWKNYL
jgi:shikimate kinase